jgi:hypothetical protein
VIRTCNAPPNVFIIYFVIKSFGIQINFIIGLIGENHPCSLNDIVKMLRGMIRS